MKKKIYAVQIASSILIDKYKSSYKGGLLFSDSDELFYELQNEQYIYVFKYGVVCLYNVNNEDRKKIIAKLLKYSDDKYVGKLYEEVEIVNKSTRTYITQEAIGLPEISIETLRLIMLNVSQSVALDYYYKISSKILEDTNRHTLYLEEKGSLDISGKNLKKYIGKVLNIKNKISENLYIFDSHDIIWGDDKLNKLDQELKKTFDLKDRYRSLQKQVSIIKENLELFKDIMFHRHSSTLEWIIIVLILVEVIDMFVLKLL
jgi:uncharacterized Rmd1/YagE family protein